MRHGPSAFGIACVLAAAGLAAEAADAKPARCRTTDDGAFACAFRPTDASGSFEVSAPGRPTYALTVTEPGAAFGFVTLGDKTVALPGRYLRSAADRACWRNDATQTEICAW